MPASKASRDGASSRPWPVWRRRSSLDSDTKVALLTNAPSEVPEDWFLTQDQVFATRARVNREAGTRRMLAHYTITPGYPGWMDPLGPADGAVKTAIFSGNSERLYRYERRADLATDRFAAMKAAYERTGPGRSNLRYGYVRREA